MVAELRVNRTELEVVFGQPQFRQFPLPLGVDAHGRGGFRLQSRVKVEDEGLDIIGAFV